MTLSEIRSLVEIGLEGIGPFDTRPITVVLQQQTKDRIQSIKDMDSNDLDLFFCLLLENYDSYGQPVYEDWSDEVTNWLELWSDMYSSLVNSKVTILIEEQRNWKPLIDAVRRSENPPWLLWLEMIMNEAIKHHEHASPLVPVLSEVVDQVERYMDRVEKAPSVDHFPIFVRESIERLRHSMSLY